MEQYNLNQRGIEKHGIYFKSLGLTIFQILYILVIVIIIIILSFEMLSSVEEEFVSLYFPQFSFYLYYFLNFLYFMLC